MSEYTRGNHPNSRDNLSKGNPGNKGMAGKVWVNKDGKDISIPVEQLDKYLAHGYTKGMVFRHRNSKYRKVEDLPVEEVTEKKVTFDDIDEAFNDVIQAMLKLTELYSELKHNAT